MSRRFREHFLRRVHSLDGFWEFAFLGDVDAESVDVESIRYDDVMAVPGCFDATPKYAGRRGLSAYRTRVPINRRGLLRWVVGSAHHRAKLFAQRKVLRGHGGGFTRFFADFTLDQPGEVELVALIDNRFDAQRSPLHMDKFDWYQYGGLAKSSELHELEPVHINGVEAVTASLDGPALRIAVDCSSSTATDDVPFRITFDGELVSQEKISLNAGRSTLERRIEVPGSALWTPAQPSLHLLGVQLGKDDLFERTGLRTIETRDGRFLLNGKPLDLQGINRHEAHPAFGHAVPPALQLSDLQLVEKLGFNFVRGSHYPQDQNFLDLCDERGMLVWNEAIGWQHTVDDLRSKQFVDAQSEHIDEMIAMSINHPSVILWGILNESASDQGSARSTYERLLTQIRRRDPSRPVTYASNRHGSDRCLDLVDVVSVNAYPGWYFGTLDTLPQDLDRIVARYRASAGGKPILLSEIGAGALLGFRDHHAQRWSEEYQAEFFTRLLHHLALRKDVVAGFCLWQFSDCRTTERVETALGRPRGFNNKGLFDEYRRPKMAVAVVERLLAREASGD